MKEATILIYDGSFNGFLSSVFTAFKEKIMVSDIRPDIGGQNGLFTETRRVFTHLERSKRVWNGIQNKSFSAIKDIYFAFLSEQKGIESLLYDYIVRLFSDSTDGTPDSTEELAARIRHLARLVGRDKNRAESNVRFQRAGDGVYVASIDPEYNILPLVSKHFRSVYLDQEWLIYDVRRQYGLYYNTSFVEIVAIDFNEDLIKDFTRRQTTAGQENLPKGLLKNYLDSPSVNTGFTAKLHPASRPVRQWGYLHGKKAV